MTQTDSTESNSTKSKIKIDLSILPGRIKIKDLCERFPDCFDLANPRPLKLKIDKDLLAIYAAEVAFPEGVSTDYKDTAYGIVYRRIRHSLIGYTKKSAYLQASVEGTPRIALDGTPCGEVNEREATYAANALAKKIKLRNKTPKQPSVKPPTPHTPKTPNLPEDAPLTEKAIVPGRLELTLKFNQLPDAVPIKEGMKIGIQTDNALVIATLRPKAWKKLTKANEDWPQWIAALSGKLGAQVPTDQGPAILLQEPNVQVFEKKPKPAAE